jgi:hypothetical protein
MASIAPPDHVERDVGRAITSSGAWQDALVMRPW